MARREVDKPTTAERLTAAVGSWAFLNIQSLAIVGWILFNSFICFWIGTKPFDPFPYVLLNLVFSTQAAYTGPIVLMAQYAQAKRDKANEQRTAKMIEAILHLSEHAEKRDKDTERLLESMLILHESTQDMIEQMPGMIRTILRDEMDRAYRTKAVTGREIN